MWLVQSEKQKQITRNITKKLCKTPERSLYFHTTTACLIATNKKTAIVIARNMVKEHILQYYKWVVNETQSQKKLDLKQQFWNTYFAENKDKVHVFKVPGYQASLSQRLWFYLFELIASCILLSLRLEDEETLKYCCVCWPLFRKV